MKAVLLYPLPGVAHQGDLVAIATRTRDGGYVNLSYPDYRDYRDSTRTLDGLVVTETTALSLGAMSEAERQSGFTAPWYRATTSPSSVLRRRSDAPSVPTTIACPMAVPSW